MNFTKLSVLIAVCGAVFLASTAAVAAPATTPAAFQAEKDRQIANIQERQQIIQIHLSCVQTAQDQAALKACHVAALAANKSLGAKIKAQRTDKIAQKVTPATK